MKVLLIQLYSGKGQRRPVYPIGLSYLATSLTAHDVRIFDQNIYSEDPFSETNKVLLEFLPEIVGISIRNVRLYSVEKGHVHPDDFFNLTVREIKKVSDRTRIVVGGPGFSMFPSRFMKKNPEINFGIYLEGEESFPQLLENLNYPERVKGIYWRKESEVLFSGGYMPPKFEALHEPKRDFISLNLYKGEYAIGIQSKRGCILNCIYCSYPFLSGKTIRLRPPEKVVDEVENLHNKYGIQQFTFVDNVFNIPLIHAEKICQELINRNLRVQWSAWFNEKFVDGKFMDLAIEAGCGMFDFSPDGYSNKSLKWLKKDIQTKHIINTYKLVKKRPHIKAWYHFIVAIPGQNIFQLARLSLFILKLKIFLRGRARIGLTRMIIEPNTQLEKLAISRGKINSNTDLYFSTFYQIGFINLADKIKKLRLLLKLIRDKIMKVKVIS